MLWEGQVHGALNLYESKDHMGPCGSLNDDTYWKKTLDPDWSLFWDEGLSRSLVTCIIQVTQVTLILTGQGISQLDGNSLPNFMFLLYASL